MKQKTKAILVDIVGVALILIAIPLGTLPGPGVVPLVILGLSLLATNHAWAERLLAKVKHETLKATKRVTDSDPVTKWGIDILSVLFIAVAIYLLTMVTKSIATTAGISLTIVGLSMLITNQNRYLRAWNRFRRKHKK